MPRVGKFRITPWRNRSWSLRKAGSRKRLGALAPGDRQVTDIRRSVSMAERRRAPALRQRRHPRRLRRRTTEADAASADPFIDSISRHGRVVDGRSLIGAHHWPRSTTYDCSGVGLSYTCAGRSWRTNRRRVYTATPDGMRPTRPSIANAWSALPRRLAGATNLAKAGSWTIGPARRRRRPVPAATAARGRRRRLVCRGRSNKEIARDMGISDQRSKITWQISTALAPSTAPSSRDVCRGGMPRQ